MVYSNLVDVLARLCRLFEQYYVRRTKTKIKWGPRYKSGRSLGGPSLVFGGPDRPELISGDGLDDKWNRQIN